jgi:uncharacterized cupredoxin-like copper-binding protein
MRFRKIALALFACMALGAIVANAAQAATQWTLETKTVLASETVKVLTQAGDPILTLLGKTKGGLEVHLTSTGVSCSGTCTISGAGHSEGKLLFSGVTVMEPASCEVAGGSVTTNTLVDNLKMDGTKVLDIFEPKVGSVFTEIELIGANCPVAELVVPISGKVTGVSGNATETYVKDQVLTFSQANQTTGETLLTIGGGTAFISGVAHNELSGTNKEAKFGAME